MADFKKISKHSAIEFSTKTATYVRETFQLSTTTSTAKQLPTSSKADQDAAINDYYVQAALTYDDAKNIVERLRLAFPNETFLAVNNEVSWFYGNIVCQYKNFRVFKLDKSSTGATLTDDSLKSKTFVWVYDSKDMTDSESRRDFLRDKLKSNLSGYPNVFVGANEYFISGNRQAIAYFEKSYGSKVLIVLM